MVDHNDQARTREILAETPYALFIDTEYCTGCNACEMACKQEWELGPDEWGIKVSQQFLNNGQTFNFIPIPTDLCNLCLPRITTGALEEPACVRHCLATVMAFGTVDEMARKMVGKRRSVIWAPTPKDPGSPLDEVQPQQVPEDLARGEELLPRR